MDYERLARELLRALRGSRSQRAFSRRLGYSTNVAYTWEAGRRWPTGAETLRAAERARVDVRDALRRFYRTPPAWLDELDPASPEGAAALLRDLCGDRSVAELARRSGLSRHAIGRWLAGATQPKLPEFLRVIEAASLRLLDLLAVLVDPAELPSVAEAWERLVARRAIAHEIPWSQAVLRALELGAYRDAPAHRPGWIARLLGISAEEEARCLEALERAGQIVWDGHRFRPDEVVTVDTRLDAAAGRRMRLHWNEVAGQRIAGGSPGQFSYNVFAVSRADLERLREMHLAYFRALRAVVAGSSPSEVVAVANVQLFALEDGGSATG